MITENKNFKRSIGLFCIFGGFFILAIIATSVLRGDRINTNGMENGIPNNYWVPTPDDIKYQDSMYTIISQTQQQLDTIHTGINKILWKLERLEYEDGSWDSIRYKKGSIIDRRRNPADFYTIDTIQVIEEDGIKWYTLDTIEVSATMYYPVVGQCDDTPDITADQTKIPNIDSCSHLNWIAVSQDLLWFNDGPIRYGDTVYVIAGHKTGTYIVRDAMNKRFKFKIDFLESVGTGLYSFDDVKLVINS